MAQTKFERLDAFIVAMRAAERAGTLRRTPGRPISGRDIPGYLESVAALDAAEKSAAMSEAVAGDLVEMPVVGDQVFRFPGHVQRFFLTEIPIVSDEVMGFSGAVISAVEAEVVRAASLLVATNAEALVKRRLAVAVALEEFSCAECVKECVECVDDSGGVPHVGIKEFLQPIKFGNMWFDLGQRVGSNVPISLRQPVVPEYEDEQRRLVKDAKALAVVVDHDSYRGFGHYVCQCPCGDDPHIGSRAVYNGSFCRCAVSTVKEWCWCDTGHVAVWSPELCVPGLTLSGWVERVEHSFEYGGVTFQELAELPKVYCPPVHCTDVIKYWVKGRSQRFDIGTPEHQFGVLLWSLSGVKITSVVLHMPGGVSTAVSVCGGLNNLDTIAGYHEGKVVFLLYAANAARLANQILRFMLSVFDDGVRVFSVCESPYK